MVTIQEDGCGKKDVAWGYAAEGEKRETHRKREGLLELERRRKRKKSLFCGDEIPL